MLDKMLVEAETDMSIRTLYTRIIIEVKFDLTILVGPALHWRTAITAKNEIVHQTHLGK